MKGIEMSNTQIFFNHLAATAATFGFAEVLRSLKP